MKHVYFDINKKYLRNMSDFPLSHGEEGESVNRENDKCNNFNYRKNGGEARYIVQHHTAVDFENTIDIFINKGVSAHYVIKEDGEIFELVSSGFRAYHAGIGRLSEGSALNPKGSVPKNDMNSWSIGIENVNDGNKPFNEKQILNNILLLEYLLDNNKTLESKMVLGHSDWSCGRKIDPSIYFPWEKLAKAKTLYEDFDIKNNFGIFPRIDTSELNKEPEVLVSYDGYQKKLLKQENILACQEVLEKYGYDIIEDGKKSDLKTLDAILSYRIHFDGKSIQEDVLQKEAWNRLSIDSSDISAKSVLCNFTENDLLLLGDVIEQF